MNKMVAIIIVGFNSDRYIKDCFQSIKNSNYQNYKVIFVDNNSDDTSIELISKEYPETVIVKNKTNLGFAQANNIGAEEALRLGAEFVLLLNPDTVIDSNCLKSLCDSSDPKSILQPLILLYDSKGNKRTDKVNTSGNVVHFLGFSYCGGYKEARENYQAEQEIAIASGAAVFIPSETIKKIALFDSDFFMYHEDVDFSWRARLAGFNVKLIPSALVWHKYSFSRNRKKMYYVERNRILFLLKNYHLKTLLLLSPLLLINEILILVFSIKEGWFAEKISTYYSVLSMLPSIMKSRHEIRGLRKETDRDLMRRFTIDSFQFAEVKVPALSYYNSILKSLWRLILGLV